jgi:hypothetical protein
VTGPAPRPVAPQALSWADLLEQLLPHADDVLDPERRESCPPRAQQLWQELDRRVRKVAESKASGLRNRDRFTPDDRTRIVGEVLAALLAVDIPAHVRGLASPAGYVLRQVRRAGTEVSGMKIRERRMARADIDLPADETNLAQTEAVFSKISERDRKLLDDLASGRVTAAEVVQRPRDAARLFVLMKRLLG